MKLDLRDEANRKTFARSVLRMGKEWESIVTDEFDINTSHMEKWHRFLKWVAETNSTCRERKLGGAIEMMHRLMGMGHIMTASTLDHNTAQLRFNTLHVESMLVPNKELGIKKSDDDLQQCLERFMDPQETNLGMLTELVPVKMRWPSRDDVNMSQLCAACRVHSEEIMERKRGVAHRSGSSLIGDVVEKFLLLMNKRSIERSPSMSHAEKVSRLPKSDPKKKKPTTNYDTWLLYASAPSSFLAMESKWMC